MQRTVLIATQKFDKATQRLEYRRLNWLVETNHRIRWEFEAFVRIAREAGFPFDLRVEQNDTPNEGTIQIAVGELPTGAVNRKYLFDWDGDTYADTPVLETGGELVASQSASGYVLFLANSRRSDRIKPKLEQLIFFRPLDPTEVTPRLIRKAIRRYLLWLQSTSIQGSVTPWERICISWMRFRDLRYRYELYTSMLSLRNEWGKAAVAGIVAFVVGYLTGSKI